MNFADWYTDTMDIFRTEEKTVGRITKQGRIQVASGIHCRIYQTGKGAARMQETAADSTSGDKLMCPQAVDILKGDELLVRRGGSGKPIRYFAGVFRAYTEPFGAVLPGLSHQEGTVTEEVRT